jgi:hypothetical protein
MLNEISQAEKNTLCGISLYVVSENKNWSHRI